MFMSRSKLLVVLLLAASQPAPAQERMSHGRFKDVTLYRPQGEVKHVVLFLSGDNGWESPVVDMARKLVDRGAMVAGIRTPQLYEALEADGDACVYPDGDLENLSHYLQGYARLPTYHTPLLVGYSAGASLAYATLAQAPEGTFAGAISLGFCVEMDLGKPLCPGVGARFTPHANGKAVDLLPSPEVAADWVVLQGTRDRVCAVAPARSFAAQLPRAQFVELPKVTHSYSTAADWAPQFLDAYDRMTAKAAAALPPPPATLADLPLVEVRATTAGPAFAVMLSGDGGWAGLDKNVAAELAKQGVDVVGMDSLRYFWTKRTPQGVANDLDRIVRYYAAHWHKTAAVLIGYSQGADVLPFAINRLPPASRQLVTYAVMMGLGTNASFEFHVGNWLGREAGAIPILPEAIKLQAKKTLCIYGADEKDSLCPKLAPHSVEAHVMTGGHHFDGAYDELAAAILERASILKTSP
jgi:type IV secretory pathway VirJ component